MAWGKKNGGGRKKGNYVAKIVNKILAKRVEDKYHDIFGNYAPLANTYAIQLLNGLTQGTGDAMRVGNEVTALYLNSKFTITFPDSTNRARLMVFWDKQPNGAVPTTADLLTYTANPVDSFLNPDSKARFHVLKDVACSGGTNGTPTRTFNWKINLRKKNVLFKGTTDTIGAIQTNALYFLFMSDSGVVPNPQIDYMVRYVYSDM